MSRLTEWLRKKLEKVEGTYHEGPVAPPRVREAVLAFTRANPRATCAEWMAFSAQLAEDCWSAGYVRGVGFIPGNRVWRVLLSSGACVLGLTAAVAMIVLRHGH